MTIQTRRLEQCRSCRYQASITAGTIFHRTRKPLRLWFLAIFFRGRHKTGISALQLQKDLGLGSYKACARRVARERGPAGHFPRDGPRRRMGGSRQDAAEAAVRQFDAIGMPGWIRRAGALRGELARR